MVRKSRAFRKGFLLGGLVGGGVLLFNAPQSGSRTREQVVERFEGLLFKVLDAPDKIVGTRKEPALIVPAAVPAQDLPTADTLIPAGFVLESPPSELAI